MRGHQLIPYCPSYRHDPAPRVSDEHLEHWGALFCERRLSAYGLTLEQFLEAPRGYLAWIERGGRAGHRPLLHWQRLIRSELDGEHHGGGDRVRGLVAALRVEAAAAAAEAETERAVPQARLAGDRYVEPLHHHSRVHCGHRFDPRRRVR